MRKFLSFLLVVLLSVTTCPKNYNEHKIQEDINTIENCESSCDKEKFCPCYDCIFIAV